MTNNEKIINDLRLDRENLLLLISKLQSNWNSLKQMLKEENYFEIVDKMNELERGDSD